MAASSSKALRNQVIYSVFVRQYSKQGSFEAVLMDLDRIKALGVDIIWFLPVHPVGQQERKGSLGSPYAIKDYRKVNPEFGSREDFVALVDAIHQRGMKAMMDVVFNHTAPDSWLFQHHPEFFHQDATGKPGNKVGEWPDIIDLDFSRQALWDYLIDTLKQWAELVDGFRCDVAPLIPLAFWLKAREEVEKVRPGCIWLSESVEPVFTIANRARGMVSHADAEMYQAFDLTYDYDIYGDFLNCLTGSAGLDAYLQKVNQQEAIYPDNYVKLRFLENHDRQRAAFLIPDGRARRNWTALLYFLKGTVLLYNGQEAQCTKRPSLFDRDPVQWDAEPGMAGFLATLYRIKQHPVFFDSRFFAKADGNGTVVATHSGKAGLALGVFGTRGIGAPVSVPLPDGLYRNRVDGADTVVEQGLLSFAGEPVVIIRD